MHKYIIYIISNIDLGTGVSCIIHEELCGKQYTSTYVFRGRLEYVYCVYTNRVVQALYCLPLLKKRKIQGFHKRTNIESLHTHICIMYLQELQA